MAGEEDAVRAALETPDEVRQGRTDPAVVRCIKVAMASGCPNQPEFRLAWAHLPP